VFLTCVFGVVYPLIIGDRCNHQQVRNNSYLTDRDKIGHNYRENSEISDRLFNSVNSSLHDMLLSGSRQA